MDIKSTKTWHSRRFARLRTTTTLPPPSGNDLAMLMCDRPHMRPVVEKEILHYGILFALDQERPFDS